MKTICKKILPWYFEAVRNGSKTFEIRKDEDGFEVGDHIILCEWSGTAYTGFTLEAEVTYVLRDAEQYGLMPGFCILGIKALDGKDTNVHTNDGKTLVVKIPKEYLDTTARVILDSDPWCKTFYEDVSDMNVVKWIPVTPDTMPEKNRVVVVCGEKGTWDYGTYRGHLNSINNWNWKKNTVKTVYWWMYKEDALPMPWEGD